MPILAATDFSENAHAALRAAAAEARRRDQALVLLHCVDTVAERWEYLERDSSEEDVDIEKVARERLEREFADLVPANRRPDVQEYLVHEGHAAESIAEEANGGDYEMVVVGATGGGALARLVLGSTAEEVVRSSEIPTLVVPGTAEFDSIERVLAPIDLSECSRASLAIAADWARRDGAHLTILHSTSLPTGAITLMEWEPSPEDREEHRRLRSEQLDSFLENVDLEGLETDLALEFGDPAHEIARAASERDSDLVVMGTHGRRGMERLFLGSTATKVLRRLPCPVLTVRHSD